MLLAGSVAVTVNVRSRRLTRRRREAPRAARVSRGDAKQSVAIIDTDHAAPLRQCRSAWGGYHWLSDH